MNDNIVNEGEFDMSSSTKVMKGEMNLDEHICMHDSVANEDEFDIRFRGYTCNQSLFLYVVL